MEDLKPEPYDINNKVEYGFTPETENIRPPEVVDIPKVIEGHLPEVCGPSNETEPETSNVAKEIESVQSQGLDTATSVAQIEEEKENLELPCLPSDYIHNGKPRFCEIELNNRADKKQTLKIDRKEMSSSALLEQNDDEDDFNWPRYTKSVLSSSTNELMLNVAADLNSPTLVALGDDKLEDHEARKHIRIYEEYMKKKEQRIMNSVEKELRYMERRKQMALSQKKTDFSDQPSTSKAAMEMDDAMSSARKNTNGRGKGASSTTQKKADEPSTSKMATELEEVMRNSKNNYKRCKGKSISPKIDSSAQPSTSKAAMQMEEESTKTKNEEAPSKKGKRGKKSTVNKEDVTPNQVKFKFKCPLCKKKDISDPRSHLSSHFADKVKDDFPFIKEGNSYICPIAGCPTKPPRSSGLVDHINLDHDQINIYLRDEDLDHLQPLVKKKQSKRKLLSEEKNESVSSPSKKKCSSRKSK